jgi:hypothetical protein
VAAAAFGHRRDTDSPRRPKQEVAQHTEHDKEQQPARPQCETLDHLVASKIVRSGVYPAIGDSLETAERDFPGCAGAQAALRSGARLAARFHDRPIAAGHDVALWSESWRRWWDEQQRSVFPDLRPPCVCHLERRRVVDPRCWRDADKVAAEEHVERDLDVEWSRSRDLERQRFPVERQTTRQVPKDSQLHQPRHLVHSRMLPRPGDARRT